MRSWRRAGEAVRDTAVLGAGARPARQTGPGPGSRSHRSGRTSPPHRSRPRERVDFRTLAKKVGFVRSRRSAEIAGIVFAVERSIGCLPHLPVMPTGGLSSSASAACLSVDPTETSRSAAVRRGSDRASGGIRNIMAFITGGPGIVASGSWRPGSWRPGSWRPGSWRPGSWRPGSWRPGSSASGGTRRQMVGTLDCRPDLGARLGHRSAPASCTRRSATGWLVSSRCCSAGRERRRGRSASPAHALQQPAGCTRRPGTAAR